MKKIKSKILLVVGIVFIIGLIGCIISIFYMYNEPKISVLCYHNVITKEEKEKLPEDALWSITVENFEEEMRYLHEHHYKTLTMDEFIKWKKGEINVPFKSVLITFDDGLLSNYHYAFPILKKYNLNATLFLIGENSEKIGNMPNKWAGNPMSYMSKEQIEKTKLEYPNVEIYSHTYGMHNIIKDGVVSADEYTEKQIEEDIDKYENYMGKTTIIAYPFGVTNENFINELKNKGYKYAFVLGDNKKATRKDDDFRINRINTSTDKKISHFARRFWLPY